MAKNTTPNQAKNADPGKHSFGDGLILVVDKNLNRRWVVRVQAQGKRRDIGLGTFKEKQGKDAPGDRTLAEARVEALQIRNAFKRGENPLEDRKREAVKIPTFEEAARAVHAENVDSWRNAKHKDQWINSLQTHAFPEIGNTPVNEIGAREVRRAVIGIWLAKPETARRVLQRIGTTLDYAHAEGLRDADAPMRAVRAGLPKQPKRDNHFEALDWREAPDFFVSLEQFDADESVKLLIEWTILTAARSGESRGTRWDEIDLDAGLWSLEPERMKAKKAHNVPLSDRCIEILERMQMLRRSAAPNALVFEGRVLGKPMSDMTLTQCLRRAGLTITMHGWRSTFRDWASEDTGFPPALCERALAHSVRDKTQRAYLRGTMLAKRKELMAAWSSYCLSKRQSLDNVTPIRAGME